MNQQMRGDVELLNLLCDEAPLVVGKDGASAQLSAKRIAHLTGFAQQTVSDYRRGKYNIPVEFWRRLLEHYPDSRIIALLLGDSGDYEVLYKGYMPADHPADFFRAAVAEEGSHHRKLAYIADILADGRIDELDETTVQSYHDEYVQHRSRDCSLHFAVMQAFRKAQRRKVGAT